MQASIETRPNGSVDVHLDLEAARAVFASVVFASRFHEGVASLAPIAEEGLRGVQRIPAEKGVTTCR
jgi:hypothetical protein